MHNVLFLQRKGQHSTKVTFFKCTVLVSEVFAVPLTWVNLAKKQFYSVPFDSSSQFFRSSRRVKMSFLYEKGRAATLLLCAYRFKKDNASLDFEQDDYEIGRGRLLPFPFSSPGRQQVRNFRDFACCPKVLI